MCTLPWSHTRVHVHVHVNGLVHAKSGGSWSRLAGSRSPQRLFGTKSSVHWTSVIKTRQSLTIEIIKSSFHCTSMGRRNSKGKINQHCTVYCTCTHVCTCTCVHVYILGGVSQYCFVTSVYCTCTLYTLCFWSVTMTTWVCLSPWKCSNWLLDTPPTGD